MKRSKATITDFRVKSFNVATARVEVKVELPDGRIFKSERVFELGLDEVVGEIKPISRVAYEAGKAAFHNGWSLEDNQYPASSEDHWTWRRGYLSEHVELEGSEVDA